MCKGGSFLPVIRLKIKEKNSFYRIMKNKDNFDQFADALVEESLQEAASTFFGKRREIEKEIEEYWEKVDELRHIEKQVIDCQTDLHFLLLKGDKQCVNGFYQAIGVDPSKIPPVQEVNNYSGWGGLLFSFTERKRYFKIVFDVYKEFAHTVKDYMYGKYYEDPEDRRVKKKSVNVEQMKRWCSTLNEKIEENNIYNLPSEVLRFCKRLDVNSSEKEKCVSTPMQYVNVDKDMQLKEFAFSCALLREYPELPAPEEVRNAIFSFTKKVYKANKETVRVLLQEIKKEKKSA